MNDPSQAFYFSLYSYYPASRSLWNIRLGSTVLDLALVCAADEAGLNQIICELTDTTGELTVIVGFGSIDGDQIGDRASIVKQMIRDATVAAIDYNCRT